MAPPNETQVLISGISGFIASQVAVTFLEEGYLVRGTVRSQAKADEYKALHSKHADRLSFAIVPDIAAPGAFTEAVKDVEIFLHTASPLTKPGSKDPENDLLKPAINGTTEALKAAHGSPTVKRVVVTSSVASIMRHANAFDAAGITYTEDDWNVGTYEEALHAPNPIWAYAISKTLAEKAAWKFVEENKPAWTLTTILPAIVYGPPTNPPTPGKPVSGTNSYIATALFTKQPLASMANLPPVDVRDVARAHFLAGTNPDSSLIASQRFILSPPPPTLHGAEYTPLFNEWYPHLRAKYPHVEFWNESKDVEGFVPPTRDGRVYRFDGSKVSRVLGLVYRGNVETVKDTADWIVSVFEREGGHVQKLLQK